MDRGRLLIVEDDPAVAELLLWQFRPEDFDVKHTADGQTALALASDWLPDIFILDWVIEGISGLEICRRLRAMPECETAAIVMLTAKAEEEARLLGLETGADDYIVKPFGTRELVARVKAVLRRVRPQLVAEILRFGDIEMNLVAYRVRREGVAMSLRPVEYRLLKVFLENPRTAFSREQLRDLLWGIESGNDVRTIDVYIKQLRQAIHVEGRPQYIRTIRGQGYSLDDDIDPSDGD